MACTSAQYADMLKTTAGTRGSAVKGTRTQTAPFRCVRPKDTRVMQPVPVTCSLGKRRPRFTPLREREGRAGLLPLRAVSAETVEIQGLVKEICDDFSCKSSPAVEKTVRQLARDYMNGVDANRGLSVYAEDVEYSDGFRSFTGRKKFERMKFFSDNLDSATGVVTKIYMEGVDKVHMLWTLTGKNTAGAVKMEMEDIFELNVITGRVIKQEQKVLQDESDGSAAALLSAARAGHAALQKLQDGQDAAAKMGEELASSDDSDDQIYADPNDPMKFFQGGQPDPMQDAYQIAIVLLVIYMVVQVVRTFA